MNVFSGRTGVIKWDSLRHYITLEGIKIKNATAHDLLRGIWVNGDYNNIRYCEIDTITRTGIVIQGSHNIVEYNEVKNLIGGSTSNRHGNNISVESYYELTPGTRAGTLTTRRNAEYNVIRYNKLFDNPTHFGVNIFPNTADSQQVIMSGNKIYNNYIHNTGGGIYTRYQRDLEIYNNFIVGNKEDNYWPTVGGGIILDTVYFNVPGKPHVLPVGSANIYNNTIADNQVFGFKNISTDTIEIFNNLFSNNNDTLNAFGQGHLLMQIDASIINNSLATIKIDNNLYSGNGCWKWGTDPMKQADGEPDGELLYLMIKELAGDGIIQVYLKKFLMCLN